MSSETQGAISVSGLRKSYDHVVLDGVSLDIPAGSVFALLGPNGAGKTTTVNILTTLIPADAGEIVVAGHDLLREHAAPIHVRVWIKEKTASLDDVEFQRLYLAFDQAQEWSPDDPRLEQLAEDLTSYLGTDQLRELDTQPPPRRAGLPQ